FELQARDVCVKAKDSSDQTAVLTASLIQEVFNIKNTGMRTYKSDIRFQELNKEMNVLYDNLEDMKRHPDSRIVLRKLKALLRRESKFAAFKRNYIRDNAQQFPQLLKYLA